MEIKHLKEESRFEITQDGEVAYCEYKIYDGCLDVRHTIVPKPLSGQGLAALLVKAAYDYAQSEGLKAVATCAYAVVWLERHPEYGGEVSRDHCEGACAL